MFGLAGLAGHGDTGRVGRDGMCLRPPQAQSRPRKVGTAGPRPSYAFYGPLLENVKISDPNGK